MTSELLGFIRSCFGSVWSLELLLFLQRHSERGWTSDELVSELRASSFVVDRSLEALVAAGLAVTDSEGRACYRPASADTARLAAAVADLYRRKPDQVRRAILSPESNLQALANAFRLRRDD